MYLNAYALTCLYPLVDFINSHHSLVCYAELNGLNGRTFLARFSDENCQQQHQNEKKTHTHNLKQKFMLFSMLGNACTLSS